MIDEIDRQLVEALQQDGRQAYTKLAARVGLSEAAVRQRVQRLIEDEVVQVVGVTNPLMLGFRRMAMVGINTEGDLRSIADAISAIDEVSYVVIVAGSFDILCEIVIEDDAAMFTVLNERIRKIKGVRSTETFTYLQLQKQTFTWGAR
ncbi:MAG: Lrp/AsnC family transcriptional regulator [Acidimicrobiia bacterium]